MMAAIVGFMPWLDRRLSILIKSGTAAKVVPKTRHEAENFRPLKRWEEQARRVVEGHSPLALGACIAGHRPCRGLRNTFGEISGFRRDFSARCSA
jgi:hypothetical protein